MQFFLTFDNNGAWHRKKICRQKLFMQHFRALLAEINIHKANIKTLSHSKGVFTEHSKLNCKHYFISFFAKQFVILYSSTFLHENKFCTIRKKKIWVRSWNRFRYSLLKQKLFWSELYFVWWNSCFSFSLSLVKVQPLLAHATRID